MKADYTFLISHQNYFQFQPMITSNTELHQIIV